MTFLLRSVSSGSHVPLSVDIVLREAARVLCSLLHGVAQDVLLGLQGVVLDGVEQLRRLRAV